MSEFHEVKELELIIDGAIEKSKRLRGAYEKEIEDTTSAVITHLEAAKTTIDEKLENTSMKVSNLLVMLNPNQSDIRDATSDTTNALDEMRDSFRCLTEDKILNENAHENLQVILKKPDEIFEQFSELKATVTAAMADIDQKALETFTDFVEDSERFHSEAEKVVELLDESGSKVDAVLENATDAVGEAIESLQGALANQTDDFVDLTITLLAQKVEEKLEQSLKEVTKGIDEFNDAGVEMVAEITGAIDDINDSFEQIVNTVEPILPVLDAVTAIT